jgi:hypothetical protein
MEVRITDDEARLLRLFRCLSSAERSDVMQDVGHRAMKERLPDKSIYALMPEAAGMEPEGEEYMYEVSSVSYVIYSGMEETGGPSEYLLGASDWDEEEAIPRFVYGAGKAALEQGRFFNYDAEFAREYLRAWRWEIVWACEKGKRKADDATD